MMAKGIKGKDITSIKNTKEVSIKTEHKHKLQLVRIQEAIQNEPANIPVQKIKMPVKLVNLPQNY